MPDTFRDTLNPWMTQSGPSGFSQMSNSAHANNTHYKPPISGGNTTLYANIAPKTAPMGWQNKHMTSSNPNLHKAGVRKIDKSVKDLLNEDLSGLKNDYSEQVQAIVDEKKQKMLNKGLLSGIQKMRTQLEKEFKMVAELMTISSAIHPTKLTKQLVHQKLEGGEYRNHGQNQIHITQFNENVSTTVMQLVQEEVVAGEFIRANSFAINHIDNHQKNYLKRLKESELADLNKLIKRLEIQLESFSKRCTTIYLPKDILRLIDMMTTFGVTLTQVTLHLKKEEKKNDSLQRPIFEESALEEFETGLNLNKTEVDKTNFTQVAQRRTTQVAMLREKYGGNNSINKAKSTVNKKGLGGLVWTPNPQ